MNTYEYFTEQLTPNEQRKENEYLNEMGQKGWELCSYCNKFHKYFWKRLADHHAQFTQVKGREVDHGKCMEKGCTSYAIKDYNGHGHWVCNRHYDKLNDEFDEEYR